MLTQIHLGRTLSRAGASAFFYAAFVVTLAQGCAKSPPPDGEGDGEGVPSIPPDETGQSPDLPIGGHARVISDFLILRDAAGTSAALVASMPCGSWVKVLAGPSMPPTAGWWNVSYSGPNATRYTGWASGKYLTSAAVFDKTTCGTPVEVADLSEQDLVGQDLAGPPAADLAMPMVPATSEVDAMFARAKLGVGYSYWWGHGAWRPDGANRGTCVGSCPSCTHTDSYGADCSGFVSKVWQVPGPTALSVDQHPFSTYNFYNEQVYWRQVSRSSLSPGDAMVRRDATSGHMALVESANDPYGALTLYEARACAAGIVYTTRTLDSSYRAIRRKDL